MKSVTPEIDFKELDELILGQWKSHHIFEKQNEKRKMAKEYTFYDGPPFANGLPHYGHLLANTIKDVVPRYWIMKGYQVDRRFGWDCHGLPVEFEVEKSQGLKGRPDILKMGIHKFNELCRESVQHYTSEWQKVITRLGRWVDWDNQYKTMDKDFMETVWWVFAEIYKKGLVYQDFKVVPFSPRTSSVVSNFEANQNYKQTQDPSVVIKFPVSGEPCTSFLVWTTTPWTLPSNLALAVNPQMTYVKVRDLESGEFWILAESRLEFIFPKKKKATDLPYEVVENFSGKDLVGKNYIPLFDYFKEHSNAFEVLEADFVTTEDGTGVVHQAPAYGEDDFFLCKKNNIAIVDPIDDSGCFTNIVSHFSGLYFKDADKEICKTLKDKNLLLRHDTLVHSYPFDERTDTPLMYKAVPSWYVAVEKIVSRLIANNQKINWVPSHIKNGRMGTWLEGARDWAISRNRFWGTPIPVWVCEKNPEHIHVFSSVRELEEKSGQEIKDIHKHYVGKISVPCEQCDGHMHVVDAVFDCWFESGSMPYAQMHYPFENKNRIETSFPADFIAEGLDQTRGWFYTLTVLASALFDKPAFKNAIVNGLILDESGKKMSKRNRNYTPPLELLDQYGADSVRLYMLNSALVRAEDLCFTNQGVKDIIRQALLPLWNAYSFLSTYAEADSWTPSDELKAGTLRLSPDESDRWIVSRFQSLVNEIDLYMQEYKLYLVVPVIFSFIDDLTNWYIRLNRRRFWGESNESGCVSSDQEAAYSTLYYVLLQFTKILAPFAPFLSDRIFNLLVDSSEEGVSVHLADMPESDENLVDKALEKKMNLIRLALTQGRSLRQKHKVKIRQPLSSMVLVVRHEEEKRLLEEADFILKSELNIKSILYTIKESEYVKLELKPNLKTLGSKLGHEMGVFRKELSSLNASQESVAAILAQIEGGGKCEILGYSLTENDFLIVRDSLDSRMISTESGVTVLLETTLSQELIAEGLARELVNRVQNLRKSSQLNVADRIHLQVVAEGVLFNAIEKNKEYIAKETLALDVDLQRSGAECTLKHLGSSEIEGMTCVFALEKTNT